MLKTKRTIAPDDPRAPDARHFAEQLRNAVANTPRDLPVDALAVHGCDRQDGAVRRRAEQMRRRVRPHGRPERQVLRHHRHVVIGLVQEVNLKTITTTTELARPLTGMYGDMTGSGEIDFWRGPAKDTYEKRVQDQQDAVTNATAKLRKLVEYLGQAGGGNMAYMASLGERLGEIYGSIVTAVIDLGATAAGALTQAMALLAHFSEVIGTAATQIVGYATALGARITEVLDQILQLEAEKADLIGLTSDGMWPSPVSD